MLKKNDLAKQFELVVQQEVKNHNDQILASNLSINKVREDLEKFREEQGIINAALASEMSRLKIQINEFSKVLGSLVAKLSSSHNDLNSVRENFETQSVLNARVLQECKAALQAQEKDAKTTQVKIAFLEETINNIPKTLHAFSERIEKKSMDCAHKIKEEVLNRPSEAKAVKEELSKRLEIDRIDFEGVTRDLLGVKKANFINEKKIENIYTLLDRLTKKLEVV